MFETIHYVVLQLLGYRLLCFDGALARGIPLDHYEAWFWYPHWKMGTYRERNFMLAYRYAGFGIDK